MKMKNLFKSHNNIQGEEQVVNKNRRRQPMRNILPVLLAIILIFLGVLAYKYLFGRTYDSYSVVNTTDITDYYEKISSRDIFALRTASPTASSL